MNRLSDGRRVVVKIGSALLVDPAEGALRRDWLGTLVADIAAMRARGLEALIVSSGAIALGRRDLGLGPGALKLEESQAAAAAGQIRLAHAYQEAFADAGLAVAQMLLTLADTEERRRHLNARDTLTTLLRLGAVPIINENDTVATSEIRYGDNDRLAARVAQMANADRLILLSDIDGLYTADPIKDPSARHIAEVPHITPEIAAMAGESASDMGSGGMVTKLAAARIAVEAGAHMAIASGAEPHPIARIEAGARATWFLAQASPRAARKRFIAGALETKGALVIDAGALAALRDGRSLLPVGVRGVEGGFRRGDAVAVKGPDGVEIGRGLCAYSAADAAQIMGLRSDAIEARLGWRGREEMIHRDDLALRR